MNKIGSSIYARYAHTGCFRRWALISFLILALPAGAFAQGSIFGTVQNADLNNPAAGNLFWFGFLDDTDEEIRIESNIGAGYDGINWFDDFQNYSTEAAGNPYDHYFVDVVKGEGFHLAGPIPSNSFQQENILLASGTFPVRPAGLIAQVASASRINISWNYQSGVTYHVYRRVTTNNGVFHRIDDPTGNPANAGVADSFFVDVNSDGVSSYTYIIIGEDASGNYSAHSTEFAVSASTNAAPTVVAVVPDSGSATGTPLVTVQGTNFDVAGASVTFGGNPATNVAVITPFELTCNVPTGTPGVTVDVVVTNTASALASAPLVGGFRYLGSAAPVLAGISPQVVDEGQNLTLPVSATDVDGDSLILSAENLPTNATFTDNYDGTGTFDFNPDFTQAGLHNVTFIASDGSLSDTVIVAITVNHINQPPVLTAIGPQAVNEGQNLNFGVTATDLDGDSLVLTALNVPPNATFADNYDGTGTFDFNPDYLQAGIYNVTFIVSDGALADTEIVAVTVNDAGNQAPVLAAIGPQAVDEGQNLNFAVSATDPDLDSLILSAENMPANATFTDNYDGTGTFDFNPDYLQAGIYDVSFIVSDGALADTEIVAITVNDAGNQTPVWTPIGPQLVTEGQNLNLAVSATDPDADSLILSAENLPANATFADNFDGTGTFDFNPDYLQAGIYNVTFIVSDGGLADTEIVAVTVNDAGNQSPAWTAIGPQVVTEGQNLNLAVSATDPDTDSLILSAENMPANAMFTDNYDGTGTFDFNPDYLQAGIYNVTFIVSDGALADTEIVAVTVNDAGNQAPVLASIGPRSVAEGQNLNFAVSANDPDLDSLILSAENTPANATFTDNYDGTGTFDFNPDYLQAGIYNVTFIVSDGALADTEIVAVTVNDAGNQAPVLASIGPRSVAEGQNLNFAVSANDPDLDSLVLSAENIPANATFTDNYDGTGTFDFNPDYLQAGIYNVTFIVSDGALADTEIVAITVNEAGNQAPVLAAIGAQFVAEGANLNFGVSVSDVDLDSLILSAEGLPLNATFTDNYDGTGTFDFNPDYTQAGVYNVTFIASDGALADTEIVAVTVNDAGNQAPILAAIGGQFVAEGANLNFGVSASDVDLDSLILSAEGLPLNATFTDNFDGIGTFDFNPDYLQAGVYNVTFIASDGALADTEIVAITVNDAGNQAPILAAIGAQFVSEGLNLNFGVSASDVDLDSLILSAEGLPLNATFTDNYDGTGTFDFNPDYLQAGIYNVTFIVSDGALADTEIVAVTVNDAGNQRPVLAPIADKTVDENMLLTFSLFATDADGDSLILSAENLPPNAVLIDNFDGTATFDFTPDYTQAGIHSVTFIASDGALADSAIVAITVNDANEPPVLAFIGSQLVDEGQNLNFGVSATDPQGDSLILTAENVPLNATFVDNGDGTAVFDFNPDFTQSGVYDVTFIASDSVLADTEIVIITVNELGNQRPVLTPISDTTIDENTILALAISAFEPDGDSLILTAENVPLNGTFTDNGDGTGVLDFSPDFFQDGIYSITFIASDALLADTAIVQITVNNVNQLPVLDPVGPLSVLEGDTLSIIVTASDADSVIPSLIVENLPAGAVFTDSANGTASLFFVPQYFQAGLYQLLFTASDGEDADSELVDLTVNEAGNQPPSLDSIGTQIVQEGDTLLLRVTASDPDGDPPVLTALNLPPGATFVDSLNGVGGFEFGTDYLEGGNVYQVTFIAADTALADTEIVTISVTDLGNLPPVFDSLGAQTVDEGDTLVVLVHAVDPEGGNVSLSYSTTMQIAAFHDSGNGFATLEYQPDYYSAGTDTVRIIATDDGTPQTSQFLDLEIITANVNEPPMLVDIGPQGVLAGDSLIIRVVATDSTAEEGNILYMTASGLPANATFSDSGAGVARFAFYPDFTQIGVDTVTFRVTDNGTPALSDEEAVEISVVYQNRAPELAFIGPKQVLEGNSLEFGISATDPDGTIPALSVQTLLEGYTFVDSGNGAGSFSIVAGYTQSGLHELLFIADDGIDTDDEKIILQIIEAGNQVPFLNPIGPLSTMEQSELLVLISASDLEGDSLVFSVDTLLPNADLVDYGDGTALFSITPDYWQDSVYNLIFMVSDGQDTDSETVVLTIIDAGNQLPIFDPVDPISVIELEIIEFTVFAGDPDLTVPVLSSGSLPGSATFVDDGGGYGSFYWETTYSDSGTYIIDILATDAEYPAEVETLSVEITVVDLNRLPDIDSYPIAPVEVFEMDTVWINAHAYDPDGPAPQMDLDTILANMTVTDLGDGDIEVIFAPDYSQSGNYTLYWVAVDSGYPSDTTFQVLYLTVNHVNAPPVFEPYSAQSTMEGQNLNFTMTATDVDGTTPAMLAYNRPANSTYTDNGDGTGTFDFNPDYTQAGVYTVRFLASDGPRVDTADVEITVWEAGEAPVIIPIGPQTITEGENLNFVVTATDVDGTTPALTAEDVPPNATFIDNADGTGTFDFNPSFTQAGSYQVRFIASDGFLADTEMVDIQVLEFGNQAPVLAPIGAKEVIEGNTLNFPCSATDPDGNPITLSVEDLPTNAIFTDYGDGSGLFHFTPDYTQAGGYPVRVIASDGALADTEMVAITVNDAGNQPPAFLDDPPDEQLVAGYTFMLRVEAEDPEDDPLTLTAIDVPANAAFVDSGNGIGGFEFTPEMAQGGSDFLVQFVVSDGDLADTVEATYSILPYVIGDCNVDGSIDPLDVTVLMNYVYRSGPEPEPVLAVGDLTCDGSVDPTDLQTLVSYVFRQGIPPPVTCP